MSVYKADFIKKLEKELQKNPRSRSFSTLAYVYYDQGKGDKAKAICLKGLKYHPSHVPPYLLLADIYIQKREWNLALQAINRAKELQPQNARVYEKMALVYTKKGDLEELLRSYKMLLVVQPQHQIALDYVSYLEKIIRPINSLPLSPADKTKLIKLNQVLARVNNYIQEKGLSHVRN